MYLLSVSQGFCNALYRPTFQGRRMDACPAVFLFSFGLVSLPLVWFFLNFICDCGVDYYQGAADYPLRKRQNKWKAAKNCNPDFDGGGRTEFRQMYTHTSLFELSSAKWKKKRKHRVSNESELCCDQSRLSIALRAATKHGQVASELISIPATLEVSI